MHTPAYARTHIHTSACTRCCLRAIVFICRGVNVSKVDEDASRAAVTGAVIGADTVDEEVEAIAGITLHRTAVYCAYCSRSQ